MDEYVDLLRIPDLACRQAGVEGPIGRTAVAQGQQIVATGQR